MPNDDDPDAKDRARRGLLRLMLKLPVVRDRLRMFAGTSPALEALCEAYEDAIVTLARLQRESSQADDGLLQEYIVVCREIEGEVVEYCLSRTIP
ncbi:hypothetical protein FDR95_03435 [Rhizobiaceae bacterium LC148]|nr:hypothetical protein YH62_28435 [Rhizobium sp. LC145]TKT67242.1 hypothetical protein FDR95_03435 [Rhizobiaceae bacterium LC148]